VTLLSLASSNVHQPTLSLADRIEQTRMRVRQSLRTPMAKLMSSAGVIINNVTLFDKQSLTCCVARALESGGRFVVSFVFEILKTVRSLLTLPAAIPGYVFEVPVFDTALEDFRDALCELACAITRILPAEYTCSSLQSTMGCGSGPSCAAGLLCHIIDVPLLLAEILVEFLATIRQLVNGEQPRNSPVLGSDCSPSNFGNCVSSVIVYVITKIVFTITQIFRDLASNLDCLLCAITEATSSSPCVAGIFLFIDPLMDLVDSLVEDVLGTIIKFVISVVSCIIYLISGDISRFIDEVGNAFTLLGEIIVNLGEAVLQFFLELPVVGDIINFFNTIISGACNFLEDAVNLFAEPDVSLSCPSSSKKRGVSSTMAAGWLKVPAEQMTSMNSKCRQATIRYNMTTLSLTEDDQNDLLYCLRSHYWKVEVLEHTDVYGPHASECDARMPRLYATNRLFSELNDEEKAKAYSCNTLRLATAKLRASGTYAFLPHDLADNSFTRLLNLPEELLFAARAYQQYRQDRVLPVENVLSQDYARNWEDSGFNTAHLANLRAMSRAQAQNALDASDAEALPELTVDAYAERAVASDTASSWWARPRVRNVVQVASAMRYFDLWFGRGGASNQDTLQQKRGILSGSLTGGLLGKLVNFTIDRLARHRVLPPPAFNISEMTNSNTSRRVPYGYIGASGVLVDLPSITARFVKEFREQHLASRAWVAGESVAQLAYAGSIAAWGVVRDIARGALWHADTSSASTMQLPPTIWKPVNASHGGTAGAFFGRLTTSLGSSLSAGIAALGNQPQAAFHLLQRLSSSSLRGQLRRERMTMLGVATRESLARIWVRARASNLTESQLAMLNSGVRISTTCYSNYTTICEKCLYLDRLLYRLENGINVPVTYYTGGVNDEPSFAHGQEQYRMVRDYMSNLSAPVIIGDSAANSPRWPPHDGNFLSVLGDPTPNKLRFDDPELQGLLSDLWQLLTSSVSFASDSTSVASTGINSIISSTAQMTIQAIDAGLHLIPFVPFAFSNDTVGVAATPPSADVFLGFINYLAAWARTCSWRDEFNGSGKRFSIGENLLNIAAIGIVLGVFYMLVPAPLQAVAGGVSVVLGTWLVFTFLVTGYSWSYLCSPALPFQLADDIMYFLVFTLIPRTPWLTGGIITNETFTSETAGICANYDDPEDGGFDYYHCVNDVGFKDIGYNLAFTLKTLLPGTLAWINETNTPLLSNLVQLEFTQTRINAFQSYNSSDAISYSSHQSCNYVYTSWSNYLILQAVLRILILIKPLISLLAALILATIPLAASAGLLVFYTSRALDEITRNASIAQAEAAMDTSSIHHQAANATPFGARLVNRLARHWRQRRIQRVMYF
jgi:hypothetical protein